MTKPIPNKLSEQIDAGVRSAISEAIERHRRLGESISILKDGQIVTLTADQIPPQPSINPSSRSQENQQFSILDLARL